MRARLVAAFVFVLAIVMLAQNIPLVDYLRDVESDRQRTGLERDAFIIAGRAEEYLETGSTDGDVALQRLVDDYRAVEGHRVVVVDRVGSAVLISDETAATGADYSTRPEIGRALTGEIASGRRRSETLDMELVYVAVPVLSGDDVVGAVRLTSPSSEIDDLVESRVRGIFLVVLIAMVLGVVVAILVAQSVSRPLRSLQKSTNQLAAGDLTTRAEHDHGPVEVRDLASAFNRMSARLQTLVEAQRSFSSDASHQLRTPLTALRLQVEQAQRVVVANPSQARDELERATNEIDRLQHLVEGLLVLSRLEASTAPRQAIDVRRVADERIDVWRPLIEEREGNVVLTASDASPWAELIPGTLEQIVDNLVDNAIDASKGPPRIEVILERIEPGGWIRIQVSDRGRGMSPEEIERAFDRFWRSPRNVSPGSGFGLPIVRRLVEANGGEIELSARPGGGLIAQVDLPSASQASPSSRT
jgi:signal transduction histidine kinase